jgi:hypothetical protein
MSETIGPRRLLSPLSRMAVDAEGKTTTTTYQVDEVITPTQAELDAFGDRLASVTETTASREEPTTDETPSARSRR